MNNMKKFLLINCLWLISILGYAQNVTNIGFVEVDPTVNQGPHKHPTLLPSASYDSQNLYVCSPYTIDMLQVIIRDEDDDIIYNNVCVPLLPGSTTFILPSTVCTDKYSIELLYGDHHLIGYF